ncbi:MAG: DUF4064 domain-containing protein [Taibaiella sp.]|nr:DUF4064 domain-containing protein [Taibaiella sp.]
MDQKPVSNAPMILGIIGGIIGLPAAICSGACATGISAMADKTTSAEAGHVGSFYLYLGLTSAILGLICAFAYKKNPKIWGILMLIAGVIGMINIVTLNMLALFSAILLIIGGAISISQKKVALT